MLPTQPTLHLGLLHVLLLRTSMRSSGLCCARAGSSSPHERTHASSASMPSWANSASACSSWTASLLRPRLQ
jgi:hypothetical protein